MWLVKILRFLRSAKILGLHRIEISGLATVKILGDIIRTMFFDAKAHGLLLRVKILGLLKSTKILGLHRIEILCLEPVKILRYFKRFFFGHLNPMACMACQNLWDFKECKDFGLTSYQNLRFNTCQNLWVFQKNRVFRHQNSTACRACQNLGVFEEHKDFGHTLYRKSQV